MKAQNMTTDVTVEFLHAMSKEGIPCADPIIPDGRIHRFHLDGDRPGSKNGWYIFWDDNLPAGKFGSWKTGHDEVWCSKEASTLTMDEKEKFKQKMESAQRERQAALVQRQREAAQEAKRIWEAAASIEDHEYLQRKNVQAYGLRQHEGRLLIPLCNENDEIQSLQRIDGDGTKRFLPGGVIAGNFFAIGNESNKIWIVEGYATGATIHHITGDRVYVAFNAGNLRPVAVAIRNKYPQANIIIAGDNDQWTPDNPGVTKAKDAADAIGGLMNIPEFRSTESKPTDFNDLMTLEGIDEVKRQLEQPELTFEAPISLDNPSLPEISVDVFPPWLKDMIESLAAATETSVELGAMLALGVLGTACQKTFEVSPKEGYVEPLNIWTIPAMDSGERKTPVLHALTKPLHDYQQEQTATLAPLIAQKQSERETALARIQSLRKKAASAGLEVYEEQSAEIQRLEQNLPPVPHAPRLWAQDITPERLAPLMAENGECLSIISDEGGLFDVMGGRYNNGIPNLDCLLQSYSGSPVYVDRQGRNSTHMDRPALTICLSPQPAVLRGLTDKPGFRGRGLLARFLYALPTSKLGHRTNAAQPIPSSVSAQYNNGIRALLDKKVQSDSGEMAQPFVLKLSNEAYQEWQEFFQAIEIGMREGGRLEHIRDWGGKIPGNTARITGLLHCAENAFGHPEAQLISIETMKKAIAFAAALIPHTLRAFDLMSADPVLEDARKVWRWIERKTAKTFSFRDCHQALRSTFPKADMLKPVLGVLSERHYIYMDESPNKQKKGRARSQKYSVNPHLTEGWSDA